MNVYTHRRRLSEFSDVGINNLLFSFSCPLLTIRVSLITNIGVSVFSIKEIDVHTLKSYLDEGKQLRLLDVRSIAEMAQGVIPNAEKLPLHVLPVRLNEIDNDDLCVLYCRSGARSAQAVGFMNQQGFDNVFNLRGGIIAWQQNGMPLVA